MVYNKYIKLILAGFVFSSYAGGDEKAAPLYFYEGKHVKVGMDMKVVISDLPDPARIKIQSYVRNYKIDYSRPIKTYKRVGYHLKEPLEFEDEDETHLQSANLTVSEAILDPNSPFTVVGEEDLLKRPYSSCGRMIMTFANHKSYSGSAVALGKNLIITAAHNLVNRDLPDVVGISFQQLIKKEAKGYNIPAKISASCFVHPKWQENYDSKYDVALLFLSSSLPVEKTDKLYMKLAEVEKDDSIKVVHYPSKSYMNESQEEVIDKNEVSVAEMIYHNANTEQGSSGSPIFDKDSDIIGIHTAGVSRSDGVALYNQGVRLRKDLLEFIDDSIEKFLLDEDVRKARAIKERKEKEDVLRKEGELKGKAEGKAEVKNEMILNCHSQNLEVSMIVVLVNMPEEEVVRIIEESKLKESASKKHRSGNN